MKANDIADIVLNAFRNLPVKAKPRSYPNGTREWVPLSGVVISSRKHPFRKCVALGTGMRCLSADKLHLARGRCLHDWHAEVLAVRAFNHYLLQECARLAGNSLDTSDVVRLRGSVEKTSKEPQHFAIREDVEIRLFSTEAPCGDASMELTMDAQNDATPWTSESRLKTDGMLQSGRGHFAELGAVRRKPARYV